MIPIGAPWIGVDLDGTLAEHHGWQGVEHIGPPVPAMVERVKAWRAAGKYVAIFSARIGPNPEMRTRDDYAHRALALTTIERWCMQHLGEVLPVRCMKDKDMVELWDDRAVQVKKNTGQRADGRK